MATEKIKLNMYLITAQHKSLGEGVLQMPLETLQGLSAKQTTEVVKHQLAQEINKELLKKGEGIANVSDIYIISVDYLGEREAEVEVEDTNDVNE
jgi:hypothetical protein